ncbi:PIG-L deacetylase family protein [Puniceicoccus vermicola]|uniref:PIG-L family deacetylase n=1 Tax=Puniceicoccus vermicola TaxID=388746 RepID=A0A7X1AXM6_9BACT|nr:PIG-L family deacetylase [Puniceicoccus vermicola]MBC2601827.1 PIG-L family deacetylase [Puniceicoccus vermicola]
MNPYLKFVQEIQQSVESARSLSVSGKTEVHPSPSKALIFAPHPDDECIIGLLPLRLMREAGMQIINIPVTFGSNTDRRSGRADELNHACAYLGWEVYQQRSDLNNLEVEDVIAVLEKFSPEIIFFPHVEDWNSRHISTHHLIVKALSKMKDFSCTVIETEFWGAMDTPNLMVEASAELVADLVAALSLHTGEVARNPYHLLLPAWMQDNVRRGGELVGGQGGAAPEYSFATLYRLRRWENGKFNETTVNHKLLSLNDPPFASLTERISL